MVPDLWQQKAVNLLRADHDVVLQAPTGSGKTFVFEHLIENNFPGKAVFTVPTRALANDKLREWRDRGWNVGIETGDLAENTGAPVVVATLETQKRRLMTGAGPDLLVIDEYQMIGDEARGVHYELAVATAPAHTRLLLLSGSVANPAEVVRWLRRIGRNAVCVHHPERPVPLDEIALEALPDVTDRSVRGHWLRHIANALAAGLGPVLVFAPRRRAAEELARALAAALPEDRDPLVLSGEQKGVAGDALRRCLKHRVAFHHSGMSYAQRAGLVEALAKANQLKVIVATTGLAAGINFSMRSVLVLDREYRVADGRRRIRPDELLQMFGRAGRRGLDEKGSVLHAPEKPRLRDAKPLQLKRGGPVDWPSLLTVIASANEQSRSPLEAARRLTARLFTREPVRLGFEDFLKNRPGNPATAATAPDPGEQAIPGGTVTEFQNSEGIWERRRAPVLFKLKDTWLLREGRWWPGLSSPKMLQSVRIGTLRKTGKGADRRYGLEAPLARFPQEDGENRLRLVKWLRSALRERQRAAGRKPNVPRLWSLRAIEKHIVPDLPALTRGGRGSGLEEKNGMLVVRLDYADAEIHAFPDRTGKGLLNPRQRTRRVEGSAPEATVGAPHANPQTVAGQWYALGLIDREGRPTRRGIITSFFNRGEGLAVAAALEEPTYPVEELLYDLANIRAGHRFDTEAPGGRPLTAICRRRYGIRTIPGYLRRGLPEDYGEGAGELIREMERDGHRPAHYLTEELSTGDIERARVEWRSLRAHVATAPDYPWERWRELREACRASLGKTRPKTPFEDLPPLTRRQRTPPNALRQTAASAP